MPSLDIVSSTYAGELAKPYVAALILSADSVVNRYVTLHENVKYRLVLKKLSGDVIQDFACDFVVPEEANLDLTEIILEPSRLMVNEQFCKEQFRDDWDAMQTGRGFINDQIPSDFQSFLLLYLASKVQEGIERAIWQGNFNSTDSTTTGGNSVAYFAGLLRQAVINTATIGNEELVAGAFTPDANGTTGILTHLDDLVGNAPDTVQNASNTVIYMSKKSLFLLQRAMAGLAVTSGGYSPTFVGDPRPTQFLGYPIITPAGFANDCLLMTYVDNLHFGTDLTSDFNQAVVVDMTQTDASDNVRVAMRFTGGCQISSPEDVSIVRRTS
jgi:hypothetical protein